jgi:DNA replication licensing factor MCM4
MGMDSSTRPEQRGIGVGGDDADARVDEEEEALREVLDNEDQGRPSTQRKTRAQREESLIELSKRDDIYELLARSLAPSIWEMEDIKKGILLQLFGGTNKTIGTGGGGGGPRYRGDINVLLVGDPGTSKSQILQVSRMQFAILMC